MKNKLHMRKVLQNRLESFNKPGADLNKQRWRVVQELACGHKMPVIGSLHQGTLPIWRKCRKCATAAP